MSRDKSVCDMWPLLTHMKYTTFSDLFFSLTHMWLEGCPYPEKMEQKLGCTFLKLFTHMKI